MSILARYQIRQSLHDDAPNVGREIVDVGLIAVAANSQSDLRFYQSAKVLDQPSDALLVAVKGTCDMQRGLVAH